MNSAIDPMHPTHDLAPAASAKTGLRSVRTGWLRALARRLPARVPDSDTIGAALLLNGSQWSDSTERNLQQTFERYSVMRFR